MEAMRKRILVIALVVLSLFCFSFVYAVEKYTPNHAPVIPPPSVEEHYVPNHTLPATEPVVHDVVPPDTQPCEEPASCVNCENKKEKYNAGIGVDLIVYENKDNATLMQKIIPDTVTIQQKYDISNKNGSTYLVVSYNIWDMFQKK
jgi:hypothetical protein